MKWLKITRNLNLNFSLVSFTFNDSKKTLTDKLIDKIMLKLSDKYKTDLGAVIRDK